MLHDSYGRLIVILNIFLVLTFVFLFPGVLEKEKAVFVELPYEDPALCMIIYLPIDESSYAVDDLLEQFSDKTINRALTKGTIHEVELEMPKMTFEGEYMLKNVSFYQFIFIIITIIIIIIF